MSLSLRPLGFPAPASLAAPVALPRVYTTAHINDSRCGGADGAMLEQTKENIEPLRRGSQPGALLKPLGLRQQPAAAASGGDNIAAPLAKRQPLQRIGADREPLAQRSLNGATLQAHAPATRSSLLVSGATRRPHVAAASNFQVFCDDSLPAAPIPATAAMSAQSSAAGGLTAASKEAMRKGMDGTLTQPTREKASAATLEKIPTQPPRHELAISAAVMPAPASVASIQVMPSVTANVHMSSPQADVMDSVEVDVAPPAAAHVTVSVHAVDAEVQSLAAEEASVLAVEASIAAGTEPTNTSAAMELCQSPPADDVSDPILTAPDAPAAQVAQAAAPCDSHLWSSEYLDEITSVWFASELTHAPRADYMAVQPDLNGKMREILVDWLHEVVARFRLQPETLFIAVQTLDRFLSLRAVHRKKLQLVGCVALMLAAKYEEIYIPEIKDFLTISDHAYERAHILHMEGVMLNTLSFRLTSVTPLRFLERFMHLPGVGWMAPQTPEAECAKQLALYLLEVSLQFVDFLQFRPSTVAAAALYLVRAHWHVAMLSAAASGGAPGPALDRAWVWSRDIEEATRHSALDLQPCAQLLYQHWSALHTAGSAALAAIQAAAAGVPAPAPAPASNKCLAVYRKFTKDKYGCVSQIALRQMDQQ